MTTQTTSHRIEITTDDPRRIFTSRDTDGKLSTYRLAHIDVMTDGSTWCWAEMLTKAGAPYKNGMGLDMGPVESLTKHYGADVAAAAAEAIAGEPATEKSLVYGPNSADGHKPGDTMLCTGANPCASHRIAVTLTERDINRIFQALVVEEKRLELLGARRVGKHAINHVHDLTERFRRLAVDAERLVGKAIEGTDES